MDTVLDPAALAFQATVLMFSFILGGLLVVRLLSLLLFHEISIFEFVGFLMAFMGLLTAAIVMRGTPWMYLLLLAAFIVLVLKLAAEVSDALRHRRRLPGRRSQLALSPVQHAVSDVIPDFLQPARRPHKL